MIEISLHIQLSYLSPKITIREERKGRERSNVLISNHIYLTSNI